MFDPAIFPRNFEGSPGHHADIVFLTMSKQLFSGQSYLVSGDPPGTGTITRIGPRSKIQLLPRSLIERVKMKRLCRTATHISDQFCWHPGKSCTTGSAVALNNKLTSTAKLRRHLLSSPRGCAKYTSQHTDFLSCQRFLSLS